MKRLTTILGVLLGVQLVLALALGLAGRDFGPAGAGEPLLSFEQDQIVRIRIAAPDQEELVLEKTEDRWLLPALQGFPAAAFKVEGLLDKLSGLRKRLPVATTEAAARRFKVADQEFERKLTLETEAGEPAVLFLGDSPGFRRLFVRTQDDSAIYEAELALFDAASKADDWTDKTYLHLKEADVERIELPDTVLERKDGEWTLADLAEGEASAAGEVSAAARKISNLNFSSVSGVAEPHSEPVSSFKVVLAEGDPIEYRLYELTEGTDYGLKSTAHPYDFTLSQYAAEGLIGLERSKLVKAPEATEPGAAEEAPPAADGKAPSEASASEVPEATAGPTDAETTPPAPETTVPEPPAGEVTTAPDAPPPATEETPSPAASEAQQQEDTARDPQAEAQPAAAQTPAPQPAESTSELAAEEKPTAPEEAETKSTETE